MDDNKLALRRRQPASGLKIDGTVRTCSDTFRFVFASASEWVKNRRAGPDVFPVSVSVFASGAKNIEVVGGIAAAVKM